VATSDGGRLARYATSTKNIAGTGLAAVGPVLGLVGVINPLLGLALAPALYAIGALAAPGRRSVDLAAGVDRDDVKRSLAEIQRRIRRRVPPEIADRVARIATTITETLPRVERLGTGSEALFILVRTATDYLPTALQAYLDLPRSYADRQVVSGGKTPLVLVCEQLDVLAHQMDEAADAVHRADTDRLIANGRFLADKFGGSPLDLRTGDQRAHGQPPAASGGT
jgi:hypothetical protein